MLLKSLLLLATTTLTLVAATTAAAASHKKVYERSVPIGPLTRRETDRLEIQSMLDEHELKVQQLLKVGGHTFFSPVAGKTNKSHKSRA